MIVFTIWPSPFSPSFLAISVFRHWLFILFWSFYSVNSECIHSNWALDFQPPITECWNPCSWNLSGQFSMEGREVTGVSPFIYSLAPGKNLIGFSLLEDLSPGQPSLPLNCWAVLALMYLLKICSKDLKLKVASIGDHIPIGGTVPFVTSPTGVATDQNKALIPERLLFLC